MVNQESTVAAVADWVCAHSTSKDSLGSIAPIKHRAARFAKEVGLYTISVAPLTMRSAGWRRKGKKKIGEVVCALSVCLSICALTQTCYTHDRYLCSAPFRQGRLHRPSPLQGRSTIRYPLKNLSLLIKLENKSLYGTSIPKRRRRANLWFWTTPSCLIDSNTVYPGYTVGISLLAGP